MISIGIKRIIWSKEESGCKFGDYKQIPMAEI